MSNRIGKTLILTLALLGIIMLVCGSGATWAAEGIASFKAVSGTVDVLRGGKLPAVVVKAGDSLSEGDFVRTRSGSFAEIRFKDGTVLKVAQRSRIDIAAYFSGQQKNGANVRLPRGKVEAIVDPARVKEAGKGRRFEVHTPNAVAGVRGTDFIVSHERNLTGVFVRHGSVYTYNRQMPDRMVTVNAGNITTVAPGAPPQTPRQALPSETQRMEKGMTAPKGTNGGQSGADNGSQSGQAGQTGSQSTSQSDSQAASQSDGQSASQTGSQTGTAAMGTQTVDSGNGSAVASDPLPVITTTFAATTSAAAATGTAPVISPDIVSATGPLTSVAAPTTVLLPPPTPPPVVSPLPTSTNVNVIVNFPPTPPPVAPPPSTNVNVNVKF